MDIDGSGYGGGYSEQSTLPHVRAIQAAENGHVNTAVGLIRDGVSPYVKYYGKSVASIALRQTDTALLSALITHDLAFLERPLDKHSRYTPLMAAAANGNFTGLSFLIDKGAALDTQSDAGKTALMLAAALGRLQTVKKLLDAGANTELCDLQGQTAEDLARNNEHHEIGYIIALHAAKDTWERDGTDKVVHKEPVTSACQTITHVFNFAAQTVLTMVEDLKTREKTASFFVPFRDASEAAISQAAQKFVELGGSAELASAADMGVLKPKKKATILTVINKG
ncbi:MAG: ankyrin repeat domain-containing protein [Alphaproteobacteria bacterium]|nr:ankyrin repeat domain-containing protein [Alphaproteobacteria bacterium]